MTRLSVYSGLHKAGCGLFHLICITALSVARSLKKTLPPHPHGATIPSAMNGVEKIKLAAAKLDPDEQYELFRWWIESDAFKQRQLAALKHDIALGIEQLDSDQYQTFTGENIMQLAEDVGRAGREKLAKLRKSRKA
jgi:hypothetical protein